MTETEKPVYKVCSEGDYVFTKVTGRASYLNSAPLKEFLHRQVVAGGRRFAFDFGECSSMDSTFLGILVGVALELRKTEPAGSMALLQLGERNFEVVRNLGIDRLVSVQAEADEVTFGTNDVEVMEASGDSSQPDEQLIREAHLRLSELNEKNARLFQDVVGFLQKDQED